MENDPQRPTYRVPSVPAWAEIESKPTSRLKEYSLMIAVPIGAMMLFVMMCVVIGLILRFVVG